MLLNDLQSFASVRFTSITVRVSLIRSYFNNLFRMLILMYTSLHVKICVIRAKSPGYRMVSGDLLQRRHR